MGVGISSTCSKAVTALHIFSISDPKECKDYNKCQVFVKSGAEEDFGWMICYQQLMFWPLFKACQFSTELLHISKPFILTDLDFQFN